MATAAGVFSGKRDEMELADNSELLQELEVLKEIYITELSVNYKSCGQVDSVEVQLHPSTGENIDQKWVCLVLHIAPSKDYPLSVPEICIRGPRGLADEHVGSMRKTLYQIAEDRKGGPMMYELIEFAKDSLTRLNVPYGCCMICLEEFDCDQNEFMKTDCYHYFHRSCLALYLDHCKKELDDSAEKKTYEEPAAKQVVCPVCREALPSDLDYSSLCVANAQEPSNEKYVPSTEMMEMQQQMAALYEKQKQKGGIIDLEEEKKKFLAPKDFVYNPTRNQNKGDDTAAERKPNRGSRQRQDVRKRTEHGVQRDEDLGEKDSEKQSGEDHRRIPKSGRGKRDERYQDRRDFDRSEGNWRTLQGQNRHERTQRGQNSRWVDHQQIPNASGKNSGDTLDRKVATVQENEKNMEVHDENLENCTQNNNISNQADNAEPLEDAVQSQPAMATENQKVDGIKPVPRGPDGGYGHRRDRWNKHHARDEEQYSGRYSHRSGHQGRHRPNQFHDKSAIKNSEAENDPRFSAAEPSRQQSETLGQTSEQENSAHSEQTVINNNRTNQSQNTGEAQRRTNAGETGYRHGEKGQQRVRHHRHHTRPQQQERNPDNTQANASYRNNLQKRTEESSLASGDVSVQQQPAKNVEHVQRSRPSDHPASRVIAKQEPEHDDAIPEKVETALASSKSDQLKCLYEKQNVSQVLDSADREELREGRETGSKETFAMKNKPRTSLKFQPGGEQTQSGKTESHRKNTSQGHRRNRNTEAKKQPYSAEHLDGRRTQNRTLEYGSREHQRDQPKVDFHTVLLRSSTTEAKNPMRSSDNSSNPHPGFLVRSIATLEKPA